MYGEALGGGVTLALAAVVWLAFLMPELFRRRQDFAGERNIARLQKTLYALAESSAQSSEKIAVELERTRHRQEEGETVMAHENFRDNAPVSPRGTVVSTSKIVNRIRVFRRLRAIAGLLFLSSFSLIFVGLAQFVATKSVLVFVCALTGSSLSLMWLRSLAVSTRRVKRIAKATRVPRVYARFEPIETFTETVDARESASGEATDDSAVEGDSSDERGWEPQQIPQPLYVSRKTLLEKVAQSQAVAEKLRRESLENEDILRLAHGSLPRVGGVALGSDGDIVSGTSTVEPSQTSGSVVSSASVSSSSSTSGKKVVSRFEKMGRVDTSEPGLRDLDGVMKKRRSAS